MFHGGEYAHHRQAKKESTGSKFKKRPSPIAPLDGRYSRKLAFLIAEDGIYDLQNAG